MADEERMNAVGLDTIEWVKITGATFPNVLSGKK